MRNYRGYTRPSRNSTRSYLGGRRGRLGFGPPVARRSRVWLYALIALAWCLAVGFAARRILLAEHAFGGRYALLAAYLTGAGAIAAGIIALVAPRRPYTTGMAIGFAAPILAALVVFRAEYDPAWWPVALGLGLAAGVVGAFVGIVFRWLVRRGETESPLLR